MGFLDKFRSKKEQEVKQKSAPKTDKKKEKKNEKKADETSANVDLSSLPADLQDVILQPHVTEKTARLAATGKYVFLVDMDANKIQIKRAVDAMYNVRPTSVNTQIVRGKVVRFGRRLGKRKNWKKAVVTLPEGKSIDIFEGV